MRKTRTTIEWLEEDQPDFEVAVLELMKRIRHKASHEELMEIVEYLEPFYEDNDPRSMGWVGNDGLP